jgi:hypothetical protein
MKKFKPSIDPCIYFNSKMRGYDERYAEIMAQAAYQRECGKQPVAFDTNKTRRKMVKPTDEGTYK